MVFIKLMLNEIISFREGHTNWMIFNSIIQWHRYVWTLMTIFDISEGKKQIVGLYLIKSMLINVVRVHDKFKHR